MDAHSIGYAASLVSGGSDSISLSSDGTNWTYAVINSGNTEASLTTPVTSSGIDKFIISYDTNNFRLVKNGGAVSQDSSGAPPNFSGVGIAFGNNGASLQQLNGYIRKFKYYPSTLSDSQLQLMTQ